MLTRTSSTLRSLQNPTVDNCTILRKQHVSVLVKKWTWIPDTLNNLYSCDCGLTCLWTNSDVLLDRPDAHLYESATPPSRVCAFHSFPRSFEEHLETYLPMHLFGLSWLILSLITRAWNIASYFTDLSQTCKLPGNVSTLESRVLEFQGLSEHLLILQSWECYRGERVSLGEFTWI